MEVRLDGMVEPVVGESTRRFGSSVAEESTHAVNIWVPYLRFGFGGQFRVVRADS